uniref:V-type proton ATPase subunit a n=1 Tax=Macrostomum lignano TaxID=282301 RepID=A0A1I8FQL6_9PLAT
CSRASCAPLIDLTAIDQNPPKAQGRVVTDEESWSNALYRADVRPHRQRGRRRRLATPQRRRRPRQEGVGGLPILGRSAAFRSACRPSSGCCGASAGATSSSSRPTLTCRCEDPASGDEVLKAVFIVFFQGDQLKSRAERREMAISVMTRIEDLNTNLRLWFIKVGKIKAIYHTLNMFNVEAPASASLARGLVLAVDDLDKIHLALRTVPGRPSRQRHRAGRKLGAAHPERMTTRERGAVRPTSAQHHRRVRRASYREANPTPFAVNHLPVPLCRDVRRLRGTAPLMFLWRRCAACERQLAPTTKALGDLGHLLQRPLHHPADGACFSVYTGLIYNDVCLLALGEHLRLRLERQGPSSYQDPPENCDVIYHGYKPVQIVLLLLIVICVPWMLLTKPLVLSRRQAQEPAAPAPAARGARPPPPRSGDQTEVTHHQTVDMAGQHGAEEEEERFGVCHIRSTARSLTSARSSCTRRSTRSSTAWAASPTRPATCACGALFPGPRPAVRGAVDHGAGHRAQAAEGFVGSVMLFFVFFFWAVADCLRAAA